MSYSILFTPPQRDLHNEGNRLYHLHHWKEMTPIFEAALLEFYKSWEGCRTLCGGPLRYAHDMDLAQVSSTAGDCLKTSGL